MNENVESRRRFLVRAVNVLVSGGLVAGGISLYDTRRAFAAPDWTEGYLASEEYTSAKEASLELTRLFTVQGNEVRSAINAQRSDEETHLPLFESVEDTLRAASWTEGRIKEGLLHGKHLVENHATMDDIVAPHLQTGSKCRSMEGARAAERSNYHGIKDSLVGDFVRDRAFSLTWHSEPWTDPLVNGLAASYLEKKEGDDNPPFGVLLLSFRYGGNTNRNMYPIISPVPGMKVGTEHPPETPSPIPKGRKGGWPVRYQWHVGDRVEIVEMGEQKQAFLYRIEEQGETAVRLPVNIWIAQSREDQRLARMHNVVSLIAQSPLRPGNYESELHAQVNGKAPKKYSTSFSVSA